MSAAYQVTPRPVEQKASTGVREPVEFEPNKPVEVALKFAQGKTITTRNGERVMFSLVDGRVMFLDPEPARLVEGLKARAGEKICVCMQWSGKRGEPREWTAWLGTDTELRRAQAGAREVRDRWTEAHLEQKIEQRAQAQRQAPAAAAPDAAKTEMLKPESLMVLSQAQQLIDVYWFALSYARREYGDGVSSDVVMGLVSAAASGKKVTK